MPSSHCVLVLVVRERVGIRGSGGTGAQRLRARGFEFQFFFGHRNVRCRFFKKILFFGLEGFKSSLINS